MFAVSIRDNITYAAYESEVIEVAKAANAHNFIVCLKDRYNTWCGDRELQLSGGQKQRIAIDHPIFKNPLILLSQRPLVQYLIANLRKLYKMHTSG